MLIATRLVEMTKASYYYFILLTDEWLA